MELLSVLLQIHLLLCNGKGVMILYFPGLFTPCPRILEGVLRILSLLVRVSSELEERYGKADGARLFELRKELAHISQGSLDISFYFNKSSKSGMRLLLFPL